MIKKINKILVGFLIVALMFLVGCEYIQFETQKEEILITFELNNGEGSSDLILLEDSILEYEDELKNHGYTFEGWYFDSNLTQAVPEDYKVKEDITVYAKWDINKYTVSCYVDGEVVQTITAEHLSLLEVPNVPTKQGYTFVGWSETNDGERLFDFEKEKVVKDFNLFSIWEPNKFTITYEIGYDVYPTKMDLYNDFFTDFYDFLVQKTDANLAKYNIYSLDDFLKFCINWNANGRDSFYGVGDAFSKYYVTIDVGGTLENQPDTTFIGYCYKNNKYVEFIPFLMTFFAYWRTDEGYTGGSSDPNNTGNDFFASPWASLVDTCKFFYFTSKNLNDTYSWFDSERVKDALDNVPGVLPLLDTEGDTENPITLKNITREGYIFLGWYDSLDENANKVEVVTESMTVYAKWEKDPSATVEINDIWKFISNPVTSNTIDKLPSEYGDYKVTWSSSNNNLYTISDGIGYTNRLHQTHKKQTVTITVNLTKDGKTTTQTKEFTINPVLFDEMDHPGAVYFSVGTGNSYKTNSERYKKEGTLFSEKFRENMDMVYYAFAVPQADGTLTLSTTYINEIMQLKNDGIRVLLVIDGANKQPLQAMVKLCNADDTRATFVNNILKLVERYNFDGVDVDWEFPGVSGLDGFTTAIDQVNLNKLLRDLRNGLTAMQDEGGSNYILSVAIPATSWGSQRYDYVGDETLGGIDDYCDYVNMMSYDSHNTAYTTHLAPHAPSKANGDYKFGTMYGVERFVSLGLSREKIILGTAAYGKAYTISGNINMSAQYPGLGLAGTLGKVSNMSGSYASGTIYYTAIQQLINGGGYTKYTEMNNGNIVGSYLLNPSSKIYITYDSVEAVQAKCEYANQYEGMGVMVWAYGEDSTDTVVHTICDTLN